MIFIIIGVLVILFFISLAVTPEKTSITSENTLKMSISDCRTVKDIVSAIGYGRLYPFYTGMTINDVKTTILKEGHNLDKFNSDLAFSQMTGFFMSCSLPVPDCLAVEKISVRFNKNETVFAITINLKDAQARFEAYIFLQEKFGLPLTSDKEFSIWRNQYMVINIDHKNNSINIINEKIYRL